MMLCQHSFSSKDAYLQAFKKKLYAAERIYSNIKRLIDSKIRSHKTPTSYCLKGRRIEQLDSSEHMQIDRKTSFAAGTILRDVFLAPREKAALETIRKSGGIIRVISSEDVGIKRKTVYSLHRKGALTQISRGVFQIYDAPEPSHPDYFHVFARCPHAVICLVSALYFHDLTDEIVRAVDLAIPYGSREPSIDWPPVKFYRYSKQTFEEGIELHEIDGLMVRVYSPEKTIADCFKFRSRIGSDIAVKALREYLDGDQVDIRELINQAKKCRVMNIIKPYMEALVQ